MSTGTSTPPREGAADGAQQKAQDLASQAQEKAQQGAEQAKGKLREQLDQRTSQAGDQINQQASDLKAVGRSLREQGQENPAKAADRIAEYAERIGGHLRDNDSEALLGQLEDLARRQPWAVAAGALAVGFAGARFLKASSRQRYSSRSPQSLGQTRAPVASPAPPGRGVTPGISAPAPGVAPGAPVPGGPGPGIPVPGPLPSAGV